jgi:hypothetical protein
MCTTQTLLQQMCDVNNRKELLLVVHVGGEGVVLAAEGTLGVWHLIWCCRTTMPVSFAACEAMFVSRRICMSAAPGMLAVAVVYYAGALKA